MLIATCPQAVPLSSNPSLERLKKVTVLLQASQTLEARAQAMLINCEHIRIQALILIERSQPVRLFVSSGRYP
jgi:hypothetical protein